MKRPRVWAYLLVLGAAFCLGAQTAHALPKLQLYSANSQYVYESWLTFDNPYTLQVVGWHNSADVITDVNLIISLPTDYNGNTYGGSDLFGEDDGIHIEGEGIDVWLRPAESTASGDPLGVGDYSYGDGIPEYPGGGGFPPHDVYPCPYWKIRLPDLLVGTAQETVHNYTEGFDPDDPGDEHTGDIQYYQITYQPYHPEVLVHADVYGVAGNKYWIAPFSHDADAAYAPEPATLGLLLAGLAGLAFVKKRRG
jgi:hypothetical protein